MCTHSDYWNCLFCCTGKNLLLFTLPIMFIASLSCVYLNLQTKKPKPSSSVVAATSTERRFASMRRPLMVRAPLGIVTTVELCFTLLFVALLIWSLYNYLYVSFTHLHTNMHGMPGEKTYVPYTPLTYKYIRIIYMYMHMCMIPLYCRWQRKFRSVSLRLGYIGNTCWAFLFFPVTRGSSILPLVGLTSESSIKYHIWLGHLSMVLFGFHTLGFIVYWAMTNQMAEVT